MTELPNFADGTDAAMLQGAWQRRRHLGRPPAPCCSSGARRSSRFSDVAAGGGKPPSEQAFKDEANALLAKLP